MVRYAWIVSVGMLFALLLSACQPVMPEGSEEAATMEESAPETNEEEPVVEAAPAPTEPLRVLFIGDDFITWNWGEDEHFAGMAAAGNPPFSVEIDRDVSARTTLRQRWEAGDALRKLEAGDWDVVVLQVDLPAFAFDTVLFDSSPEDYNIMAEEFPVYAAKFAEAAQQSGATTVIVVPWDYLVESYVSLEDFVNLVETAAAASGAEVAPVGQAWERVMEVNPDAAIYDPNGADPTIRGTYLSAAVLYATLLGLNPSEVDYSPASILPEHRSLSFLRTQYEGVPPEDLAFLRRMAWETVQEYQAGE